MFGVRVKTGHKRQKACKSTDLAFLLDTFIRPLQGHSDRRLSEKGAADWQS
jgi:hypothetical protein